MTAAATATAQQANGTVENNGRDSAGRFAAGNRGGPGNPFARQVATLRQALIDAVTAQDITDIARALIAKARAGDVAAAKLLLGYALGKPAAQTHPDRLDLSEWQYFKQTNNMLLEITEMLQSPEPSLPLTILRSNRPLKTKEWLRDMLAQAPGLPPLPNGSDGAQAPWHVDMDVAPPPANGRQKNGTTSSREA
jgi:hypothetical protein